MRERSITAAASAGVLTITVLFALLPFAWMLTYSVMPPDASATWAPTVANYRRAVEATPLVRFLMNGAVVCSAIVMLQILVCAPCGYALAKMHLPGGRLLRAAFVVALIIPQHVLALPLFWAFAKLNLLNTYAALVLPFVVSPFGVLLFSEYFKRVPSELVHAARIDGLSELEIILYLMLPAAAPAAAAFAIFSIIAHWNDLFWPLVVVQSEAMMPPAVGILAFSSDEAGAEYGPLMAAATIIVAPLLLVFLATQRLVIRLIGRGASS